MLNKPLHFTRHARNRMRLRRIDEQAVEECIQATEARQTSGFGRTNAWKKIGEGYLRMVYVEEEGTIVIITVIFPAKAPEEEALL